MAQFNKSDLVQLRSGGPVMTVPEFASDSMGGAPKVWTVWFDLDDKEASGTYPPEALKSVRNYMEEE